MAHFCFMRRTKAWAVNGAYRGCRLMIPKAWHKAKINGKRQYVFSADCGGCTKTTVFLIFL